MSEVDHYSGKLIEIPKLKNETLDEQCKRLLKVDKLNKHYGTFQEMFEEELYEEYKIHKNVIYKLEEKKYIDCSDDIFVAHKNNDGTIAFEVQYYNGGCCFSEALDYALNKLI